MKAHVSSVRMLCIHNLFERVMDMVRQKMPPLGFQGMTSRRGPLHFSPDRACSLHRMEEVT